MWTLAITCTFGNFSFIRTYHLKLSCTHLYLSVCLSIRPSIHLFATPDAGLPQRGRAAAGREVGARRGDAPGSSGHRDVRLQLQAVGPPPPALGAGAAAGGHPHRRQHDGRLCSKDPLGRRLPGDPAPLLRRPESSPKVEARRGAGE